MATLLMRLSARYGFEGRLIAAHEAPALLISAGFALVIALGVIVRVIGYDAAALASTFLYIALLWLCGSAAEFIGARRLGQRVRLAAVFILLAMTAAWASDVLAVVSRPYADRLFVAADARLFGGFDWPAMIALLRPHVYLLLLLSHAYASLNWQPVLLLALLGGSRDPRMAWHFLAAWGLALACSLLVFPFCPAVGGFVHFGIARTTVPGVEVASAWVYPVLLEKLRSGAAGVLDLSTLDGIIAMPSFHAAAAVMLGWGFFPLRWLRWPFLALNLLMLVSAVPIGGHYLVDVLAGALVAGAAILFANRWIGAIDQPGFALARRPSLELS